MTSTFGASPPLKGTAGVALVVGRAGTGKIFALGAARHAWQLDATDPWPAPPTGIAIVSLEAEGFEEVATCDRLLADLDHGREQLESRTVLVVDEAGMLGSRKLARLLGHAGQARVKVVLVGDDRQLSAIDAGGGFRALRLTAVVAAGVAAWLAAAPVAPGLAAPAGVTVAAGLGWLLRFRSSPNAVAWRRGAAGERRTARPTGAARVAVLRDLAIPGSAASLDHLVIGPWGVLAIDSKQ
jgi:hypothetical protein